MQETLWNIPKLQRFVKKLPEPKLLKIEEEKFKFCVVGGTFDRLHMGHKTLLTTALSFSKKILVCITTDNYVKGLKKVAGDIIESFQQRFKRVRDFIKRTGRVDDVTFCSIDDPFSPAISSQHASILDSIVISADESVVGRTRILNELRRKRNLPPLKVIQIPLILDPYGRVFSSTRYRLNDYFPEPRPPEFKVVEKVIENIRKPKGVLVDSPRDLPDPDNYRDSGIIAIGDAVFVNMMKEKYPVSVAIIDSKIKRQTLEYTVYFRHGDFLEAVPMIPTFNPPGSISTFSWFSIMVAFIQPKPTIVRVYGEEDLMGFPATILAPEGSLIVYGDPFHNKIVYYTVNGEHKAKALSLLRQMEKIMRADS